MEDKHWSETEEGNKKLLEIINEKFLFDKDGNAFEREKFCEECKNELIACVCLD